MGHFSFRRIGLASRRHHLRRQPLAIHSAHERAAPVSLDDQPFADQHSQRLAHDARADIQGRRQGALRGQLIAHAQILQQ